MTTVPRILIALDSHDPIAWQAAVRAADTICASSKGVIQNVVLLVHTKAQIDQTDLARHIGAAHAKMLSRGDALNLPSGAKLRCETVRTLSHLSAKTVVIAFWAAAGLLDHVDGLKNLGGIVAVPEFPDSADAWEERWSPEVFGRAAKPATTALIADSVVEKALDALTQMINLSTGLVHPRDKEHAKDTLRILRAYGHKADPAKIKSWAITRGWRPKDAADLAALSDKILGQKTKPSLTGIYNAAERYDRWK